MIFYKYLIKDVDETKVKKTWFSYTRFHYYRLQEVLPSQQILLDNCMQANLSYPHHD